MGVICSITLVAVTAIAMGQLRFVARDEGFYLYAARLVAEGHLPYHDFFLPQTPLTPVVYAAAFLILGPSWITARLVASLFTLVTAALLGWLAPAFRR
jgi:hypothetical protein